MSYNKSILTAVCCYCLLATTVHAVEESAIASPLYQCPAYLKLYSQSYTFKGAAVYSGPIEEQAILIPEPHPDENPSFGMYETAPEHTLHVECHYKDTEHYLVLEAKGARWCAFTQWTPTWCE